MVYMNLFTILPKLARVGCLGGLVFREGDRGDKGDRYITQSSISYIQPLEREVSSLDFDTFPEGDVSFNVFGSIFCFGIVPGCVFIDLSIDFNGVITGNAFPRTGGVSVAFFEILLVDSIGGKVLIALNYLSAIALG
jgi:hypothetical protein